MTAILKRGFMGIEMEQRGWKNLTASTMRDLLKLGWEVVGFFWHEKFREKHFDPSHAREYGYSPRAGEPGNERKSFWTSYTGRKIRKFGHRNPLEWSGESRQRAREIRLEPTSNGVTIRLNTPRFNWRGSGSEINMRDEMTRVTNQELDQASRFLDGWLAKTMDENNLSTPTAK